MTKKKRNEEQPTDFKNNPFKSLKGFAPCPPSASSVKTVRKKAAHAGDEGELFLQATAGVRKLHNAVPTDSPATEAANAKERLPVLPDQDLFTRAMQKIGTVVKNDELNEDEDFGSDRRSRSSRIRQLKRGSIRICQEIDLHGFIREEALRKLERFIAYAYNAGEDAVLVITGKGINSQEGPVLQGAVAAWLHQKGKELVAEFAPAPRDKGGSGAIVVFLRKK
jgi:DNA-nicking Smr family endonuclease